MLHAAVDKLIGQDMAGVSKDAFLAFAGKADYFALGHIHSRQEHLDFIYNPGAPESVHIDEVRKNQEKGFYHVCIEGREKSVTFVPSRRRIVKYFDCDVTGISTPALIADRVISRIDSSDIHELCQPLVQVNIYGTVDFNSFTIDAGAIADTLKERYNCLAVEVLNNVNLVRMAEAEDGSEFDRSSVERHVIAGLVKEDGPEFTDIADEITNLILKTKGYALSGVDEDEIIAAIGEVLESMPLSEAAISEEEELTDEDQENQAAEC
jgi:DNA repair exonuclease SbcCD nuclease subunit